MKKVIDKLEFEEGKRLNVYICPAGHLTIGIGTKLPLTDEECELISEYRGVNFTNHNPEKIYDKEAYILLKSRLHETLERLNDNAWFRLSPENVRIVLIDMAYQLGYTGLTKFKKMIKAIEEKNFGIASDELMDSKYASDTPKRAVRNRDLMKKLC